MEVKEGEVTREIPDIKELRKTYVGFGYEEKMAFLGALQELLRQYENAKGKEYDAAESPQERLGMLLESGELRQLIYSVAVQKRTTSERPLDDVDTLWWRQIEEFFGAE